MARIITTTGKERPLVTLTLKAFQDAVGGFIEPIYLPDGKIMLVNEEGLMQGLPVNEAAMAFLSRYGATIHHIVGDVVVCEKGEFK